MDIISEETCPNSPSADRVSSLNRVRERQSEEEEVSRRPQCEWEQREIERQTETILLYPGAHDALVCRGPFGGIRGRQQTKLIRSSVHMQQHTHTHSSAHTHPHIKQPIPPTSNSTQDSTSWSLSLSLCVCVCVCEWETCDVCWPIDYNIHFIIPYSQ